MSSIWIGAKDIKGMNANDIMYYQVFLKVFEDNADDDINSKCIAMITLSYLCDMDSVLSADDIAQIVSIIYQQFEGIIKQTATLDDAKMMKKYEEYKEIVYNALIRVSNAHSDTVLEIFVHGILKYLNVDVVVDTVQIDMDTLKVLMDWMAPLCLDNNPIFYYPLKIVMQPLYSCLLAANNINDAASCFNTICIILDHNQRPKKTYAFMDEFLTQMITQFEWPSGDTENEYELALVINKTVSKLMANASNETQIKLARHCIDDVMSNGDMN
eukprot:239696_1